MCVLALAFLPQPVHHAPPAAADGAARGGPMLVVLANRDEAHARPTAALAALDEAPGLFGGRDLEKGGGWLWARADGRLAAVTNVRVRPLPPGATDSRGDLVASFCAGRQTVPALLGDLATRGHRYGPFNLLAYDGELLGYACNVPGYRGTLLEPGIHSVANGRLGEPWAKARRLERAMGDYLAAPSRERGLEPLFEALADDQPGTDDELPPLPPLLPGTEVAWLREPPFLRDPRYGTRSSSVVVLDAEGLVFEERRFDRHGAAAGTTRLRASAADYRG